MMESLTPFIIRGYPMLDVFWTILLFFVWVLWIFLLIRILSDIFRSPDLSGGAKALWTVLVIIFPLIAVVAYLIVRGGSMHERETRRAESAAEAMQAYFQPPAAMSTSVADEIAKLADLRDRGIVTPEEFAAQKARLLA